MTSGHWAAFSSHLSFVIFRKRIAHQRLRVQHSSALSCSLHLAFERAQPYLSSAPGGQRPEISLVKMWPWMSIIIFCGPNDVVHEMAEGLWGAVPSCCFQGAHHRHHTTDMGAVRAALLLYRSKASRAVHSPSSMCLSLMGFQVVTNKHIWDGCFVCTLKNFDKHWVKVKFLLALEISSSMDAKIIAAASQRVF